VGALYVLEKAIARRWHAPEDELASAGLSMPSDVQHHFVTTTDGGRIHVVEAGQGPPIVLVHGITLGVGIWVRQFRGLAGTHRVIAIDQRGHGQSIAGTDGYRFERLADDLVEVLAALDVRNAVVVGHSLGGMVLQQAALDRAQDLGRHASGLVLLSTDAGPTVPGPLGRPVGIAAARVGWRAARFAERRGKSVYPGSDVGTWGARVSFGNRPRAADVELTRSLSSAVAPSAMAELLAPLLSFDVRARLGNIALPTLVVVGSRDLLTPVRRARQLAARIPGARLEVLAGCGHLAMLERPEELDALLHGFAQEVAD
jgi:pimeloyl-ACP methyl ester carboxylesterase